MQHGPSNRLAIVGILLVTAAALWLALHPLAPPTRSAEQSGATTPSQVVAATTRATARGLPLAGTEAAPAEQLAVLAEDDAAPWSSKDGTGYANDVVRAAFQAAGVNVRLLVVPYARAKNMTIAGEAVACFSMSWLPELEGKIVFADKPLFDCYADYFHRLDKPLTARTEAEIDKKIVVGSYYREVRRIVQTAIMTDALILISIIMATRWVVRALLSRYWSCPGLSVPAATAAIPLWPGRFRIASFSNSVPFLSRWANA
ncbi:MAG: hypothetical protein ACHRHE_19140 [Tepidisphaerales bacterium]